MKPGVNYDRIFKMAFASVYPHYVTKVEKKGRTKDELHTVIRWLTGYTEKGLQQALDRKVDFETFPLRRDETSSPRRPSSTRTRT